MKLQVLIQNFSRSVVACPIGSVQEMVSLILVHYHPTTHKAQTTKFAEEIKISRNLLKDMEESLLRLSPRGELIEVHNHPLIIVPLK